MPPALSFALATVGVSVALWLAWTALNSDSVAVVGSARNALIAITIVGMAACSFGVGQAPAIGWTNPITIFGIVVGVLALAVAGAGIFGWDGVVRPLAGAVPIGSAVAATTERVAIGLLAGLIAVKWVVGIPLAVLAGR